MPTPGLLTPVRTPPAHSGLPLHPGALAGVLTRQGSTAELRLLAAEFTFLDEQLAALAAQVALGTEVGAAPRGDQQAVYTLTPRALRAGGRLP